MSRLLADLGLGLVVSLAASAAAWGADPPKPPVGNPGPGEYVTEGGRGHLTVTPGAARQVNFKLDYLGANGHSCQLDGAIRDGMSKIHADPGEPVCVVTFRPASGEVNVDAETDDAACRGYCGARAWFADRYLPLPPPCRDIAARQKAFDGMYRAKRYAEAYQTLDPVFQACDRLLYLRDDIRLRNDLAITLHHLQRDADCRELLKPVLADFPHTEAEVRESLPPGDADDLLPGIRASWHNARTCGG